MQYTLKFLSKKVQKSFTNSATTMVQGKMKWYSEIIYGREDFRFYILYDRKNWQNFEMQICLLRREGEGGNISRKNLLRN